MNNPELENGTVKGIFDTNSQDSTSAKRKKNKMKINQMKLEINPYRF